MLDLGDVNSEAGVRAIGEALANASFLNGTCYPSRDDLAAYGSIDASRAPLASDPRTLAWHAAIDALVKTKFKGQGEGVVILPREPLPPPPARITAPDQIVPIEHSRALCRAAGVELTEVDDEPHKMWGISPRLTAMVLELAKPTSAPG